MNPRIQQLQARLNRLASTSFGSWVYTAMVDHNKEIAVFSLAPREGRFDVRSIRQEFYEALTPANPHAVETDLLRSPRNEAHVRKGLESILDLIERH